MYIVSPIDRSINTADFKHYLPIRVERTDVHGSLTELHTSADQGGFVILHFFRLGTGRDLCGSANLEFSKDGVFVDSTMGDIGGGFELARSVCGVSGHARR